MYKSFLNLEISRILWGIYWFTINWIQTSCSRKFTCRPDAAINFLGSSFILTSPACLSYFLLFAETLRRHNFFKKCWTIDSFASVQRSLNGFIIHYNKLCIKDSNEIYNKIITSNSAVVPEGLKHHWFKTTP